VSVPEQLPTPAEHLLAPATIDAGLALDAVADTPVPAEPILRLSHAGTEFVVLGTAHVSKASADAVSRLLQDESFDAVAVELCSHRAQALRDPDAMARMDLLRVLREGRAGIVAASLALSAYQRRLAAQVGIDPGAEMRVALEGADARGVQSWLIDRDIGITLRRTRAAVGFWQRMALTGGLIASVLEDSEVDPAEIEKLKQGDLLHSTFGEFARRSPALYEALIAERDRYMAARLREEAARTGAKRVLAVVGAGHLEGIARELVGESRAPAQVLAEVNAEPPPSHVAHWIGMAILALVLFGFVWAFMQGKSVGIDVVLIWVAYTAVAGALGALAAGAHPLSIIASAIASPITPFHPALSSGMVSGATELWLRRPSVGDFTALKEDLGTIKGWWRNRVARVFLTFVLSNLGTSLGVWIAGARMAARLASHDGGPE